MTPVTRINSQQDLKTASAKLPLRRRPSVGERLKDLFDFLAALVLMLAALPMICLAGIAVKLTSRGPILYHQARVGRFGRVFYIHKVRTMIHNCESSSGAKWSSKDDPRVTYFGRILRKTHLDELPQLWNVLRGEMSLVGPRPERPEFVSLLEKAIDGYSRRLAVKPGLTGLAQIQLPPDSNLESVRNKLALDLVYVYHRTFVLDLRLMIGTVLYLVGFSFSAVRRLMRLPESLIAPTMAIRAPETFPQSPILPSSQPKHTETDDHQERRMTSA